MVSSLATALLNLIPSRVEAVHLLLTLDYLPFLALISLYRTDQTEIGQIELCDRLKSNTVS
jgi:hypothetical protein